MERSGRLPAARRRDGASSGEFTRFPDSPVFIPEVIRTPGYPAFVAVIYRLFGDQHAAGRDRAGVRVRADLPDRVRDGEAHRRRARRDASRRVMTALFPPLPYYGALVLTEVWTTFVLVTGDARLPARHPARPLRAISSSPACCSAPRRIVRPAFVLLPFGLAIAMPLLVPSERNRGRRIGQWAAFAVAAAITMVPWFTYNYVYLGRFTLSPAGGIGRGLWEGSWQGRWPGRVAQRSDAHRGARPSAPRSSMRASARSPPATALRPTACSTTCMSGATFEKSGKRRPIRWSARAPESSPTRNTCAPPSSTFATDLPGWVLRRRPRRAFILWASDIPIRYTDINVRQSARDPRDLAAAGGAARDRGGRHRRVAGAAAGLPRPRCLTLPLLYVTGVHVPLLCETRQSLPVKPLVIVLAAVALTARHAATAPTEASRIRNGSIGTR